MRLFSTFIFILLARFVFAQTLELSGFEEKGLEPEMTRAPILSSQPPDGLVRCMPEWEEIEGLAISWVTSHQAALADIVKAARLECNVIICCASQTAITQAKNYLTSKGVDWSSNVTFIQYKTDSVWMRDYGPNTVYANDVDSLLLVDWIYNRNRPLDDSAPQILGSNLSLPVFKTNTAPYDLVNTGGNFMADGLGTGFSSKLVMRNNDQVNNPECNLSSDIFGSSNHTEAGIDSIMRRFMGISRYIKLEELPYDCIHHIDMHIKLLDEETLLVGQYPEGVADGPQIEANLQYILNNFKSAYGTPYKVIRIPMPSDAQGHFPNTSSPYYTYVNAAFVNKSVLVPTFALPSDVPALDVWKSALPGYNIVGINSNSLIGQDGAIHCITKEIGVRDPLRIIHQPLGCQESDNNDGYLVKALIQHRSGINGATLWYRTNPNASWSFVNMQSLSSEINVFAALIPPQVEGSTIYYYIEAKANNGKVLYRPMPAPNAYWTFCVKNSVDVSNISPLRIEEIFPNPSAGVSVLPILATRSTPISIRLLNSLGQELSRVYEGVVPEGKSSQVIDASNLRPGAYFVSIQSGSQRILKKLMVN